MDASVDDSEIHPRNALTHTKLFYETDVGFASMEMFHLHAQRSANVNVPHRLNPTRNSD
jgi:hypothetical protein